MSDIKYIIAGENGENTRFRCLAMVRYTVAAAVTMLTVVVIVLVIHAVFRSEDIHLSVNNGFIGADTLYMPVRMGSRRPALSPNSHAANAKVKSEIEEAKLISRRREADLVDVYSGDSSSGGGEVDVYSGAVIQVRVGSRRPLPRECNLGCSGGQGNLEPDTQVTFQKANKTTLRVILIANNPGGRTKIDCNSTTVSLVDMQYPYGVIGVFKLENFTVPPQTTITLLKHLEDTNTTYIWQNYGGEIRLRVQVLVTASVTSYPLRTKGETRVLTYISQPVTIGLTNDEAIFATDHVDCSAPPTP